MFIGFYRILDPKLEHLEIDHSLGSMNERKPRPKLWKMIQEAGTYLLGQLPSHPNHPKGRNPYAHVALCVKEKFGNSYKDIPDEQFDEVLKYIEFLKENPN